MNKKIKFSMLAISIVTISIIVTSGFITAYASFVNYSENERDWYDEKKYAWLDGAIASKYPNASKTKLAEVKAQALKQIAINEKKIADTKGAILKNQPIQTRSTSYMVDYLYPECYNSGVLENPTYLEGTIDSNYARFYTPYTVQTSNAIGEMSSLATGDIYVVAKLGPTGDTSDYSDCLILWGSNTSDIYDWDYIGWTDFITVPYNYPYNVYIWTGDIANSYQYITVGTLTNSEMPITANDVMASAVWATGS